MSMDSILLDFSTKPELRHLPELAEAFRAGAGGAPFFLAGALARDLLLQYGYGIDTARQSRDVDLALMVPDWDTFERLRARLIAGNRFSPIGAVPHKLLFAGFLEVDLIPFGAVERADRSVALPPDGDFVMSVSGFREAFGATVPVRLPREQEIHVVSLPGLAVLKLMAWKERRLSQPRKDAFDLALVLQTYLDAGNHERLYTEAAHLLDRDDFDFELAGAWLLGHDMAQLLPASAQLPIGDLLSRESDPRGAARLVGDMPLDPGRGLALLQSVAEGFLGTGGR